MRSAESQNARRSRVFGSQAGNPVNDFGSRFLGDHVGGVALNREDLSGVGKIDEPVQLRAGPDSPLFEAAVAFIGRDVMRGEKTPVSTRRCLGEAGVGCL